MRYAEPRKLQTKRGERKARENPYCLGCHQPMAKHGKNWSCSPCHIATRSQQVAAERGRPLKGLPDNYPYCIRCRRRMQRHKKLGNFGYLCANCGASQRARTFAPRLEVKEEARRMIAAGYTNRAIMRSLHMHYQTVADIRRHVKDIKHCTCGQIFYHVTSCARRPGWQSQVRERRSMFDQLLVDINRRVPRGLPEEMREEICQTMLLDITKAVKQTLGNVQRYIREYKRDYPFQMYSIDADPKFAEAIVG